MNRRHAFAAVALGTAAVFLATACGPADSGSSAPTGGAKAPTAAGSGSAPASDGAAPSAAATATAKPAATAKATSPVRTETLADGSKAEIYRLGDQHYRAKIVNRGEELATIEAGNDSAAAAGLDANDMFIVLTIGGEIHSWMGGGHQGPGTFSLPGWNVKVTKIGELHYRADILGNQGEVETTVETADQHDVGLDANGVYIVLSNGGVISGHQ